MSFFNFRKEKKIYFYRKAVTEERLDQLIELDHQYLITPWQMNAWDDLQRPQTEYSLTVLEKSKRVIGFVLGKISDADQTIHIVKLLIIPEYRRRGKGFALLQNSVKFWRQRGMQNIYLEVEKNNEAAVCLYYKFGFTRCHQLKNFYGKNMDAISMLLPTTRRSTDA